MSPRARRAMHEALDLVLDALAEDARVTAAPKRKRPAPKTEIPAGVSDLTIRRANEALKKAGLPHM